MDNRDKLARQWAEDAKRVAPRFNYTAETHAAIEHILATTATPTMADVKWATEYIFAGASDNHGTEVVMLDMWREEDGEPELYVTDPEGGGVVMEYPGHYTPNGKRYQITEVPDHPATLSTLEDYENAPVGTVVAHPGYAAFTKNQSGRWTAFNNAIGSSTMAVGERVVLRWGWGESDD